MGKSARVSAIEVLREVKGALKAFETNARAALSEVDADVQRTGDWLRMQQLPHWQKEIRKRSEEVAQARSDLLRKQLSAMQENPTCVDERRALEAAKASHEEAQRKLQVVRKWITLWDREATLYKGQTQPLADTLMRDIPEGCARLDRMSGALSQYVAIAPARVDAATGEVAGGSDALPMVAEAEPAVARFARLRRRTPRGAARARLLVDKPALVLTGGPAMLAESMETLGRLGLDGQRPGDGALVLVELGALRQGEVYFERVEPAGANDSGWFIGMSGGGPMAGEAYAISMAGLLAKRPDLSAVLALRPGCLVASVAGAIEAVLDESDADAWEAWR